MQIKLRVLQSIDMYTKQYITICNHQQVPNECQHYSALAVIVKDQSHQVFSGWYLLIAYTYVQHNCPADASFLRCCLLFSCGLSVVETVRNMNSTRIVGCFSSRVSDCKTKLYQLSRIYYSFVFIDCQYFHFKLREQNMH